MAVGELYKQIVVWKRLPAAEVVAYVCLQRVSDGKFCVQSAEFFQEMGPKDQWDRLGRNMGELFFEDDPDIRCNWFPELIGAIAAHDKCFSEE